MTTAHTCPTVAPSYTAFLPAQPTVPFKCPVCDGTGLVSRPPHVAGDLPTWVSGEIRNYACRACEGRGVLWRP